MVGGLEQMVLLGVLHLEEGAYAVTIRRELEGRSGKRVSRGALYTVLERLESKGYRSEDREDTAPVAIVSQKFAERSWPGIEPMGRRFRDSDDQPWLTVVGVSGDVLHDWFLQEPQPTYYVPFEQQPRVGMFLAVRTLGEPEAVTAAVRSQVQRVDPDQPIFHASTMRQLISERLVGLKYAALVMGVLGFIAWCYPRWASTAS